MSSKPSSVGRIARHDAAVAARSILPVLLVFLAYFVIAGAVSTAAIPDISIFNIEHTHDQLKFRLWADSMTYPVVVGAVVFGAAVAFFAFRFLMIKVQATAYLSLPLSRARVFATRAGVSLLGMLLVLALAVGASWALNLLALGPWEGEALQVLYVLAGLFVCACVGYGIMLAAVLLAGTQLEALLFGAALLLAVSVLCWGANALMVQLLVGNTAGATLIGTQTQVGASLLERSASCNPLLFFVAAAAQHQSFTVMPPDLYAPLSPGWGLLGAWLLFAAVLLAVCELLFCRRPGEKAGIAGLCPAMTAVLVLVTGVLVFGAVFSALAELNRAWAVGAGLACALLAALLMLRSPLRGCMRLLVRASIAGGEAAVLLVAVGVMACGAFGWSSAVPAASSVQSASVSYTGAPSLYAGSVQSASSSTRGSYLSGTVTCTDPDEVELITQVHAQLAATGSAAQQTDYWDFSQTVVPFDVCVSYELSDGSTMSRYYSQATLGQLASLLALEDGDHLSALRAALASGSSKGLSEEDAAAVAASPAAAAFASGSIFLADANLTTPLQLSVTPKARRQLLKALAADLQAQTVQQRYYPASACSGAIMFSTAGASEAETFTSQLGNAVLFLDEESFPQTMAWLQGKGLAALLQGDAADIGPLTVVRYDPYARKQVNGVAPSSPYFMAYRSTSADDFLVAPEYGNRLSVKNAKQKRELLSKLRASYYMDGGGYLVCAFNETGQCYCYSFLPQEDAPQWLVQQVG